MADRPILFSASMIRAILREIERPGAGKTQTRRVLTKARVFATPEQPAWTLHGEDLARALQNAGKFRRMDGDGWFWEADAFEWQAPATRTGWLAHIGHAPGDRLYVREAWCSDTRNDGVKPSEIVTTEPIWFSADGTGINLTDWSLKSSRNRPGMFLPRWASRITLIVTDVRVQRLQEINREDAIAEGLEHDLDGDVDERGRHVVIESWRGADFLPWLHDPIEAYADLWDQLNHARGYGWHTNPWIVAYTFRPVLGNIDQVQP